MRAEMPTRRIAIIFTLVAVVFAGCGRNHGSSSAASATPFATPKADAGRGRTIFAAQCAACHGENGRGGPVGPPLKHEKKRRTLSQVLSIVRDPDPPMPKLYPGTLSERDLKDVAAYVESL
jgi:mono/diheme cytochrome c family protein